MFAYPAFHPSVLRVAASIHLLFSFLARAARNARLKCRLLCEPVPYIRNRSLSLVPLGEARSQRKHVRLRTLHKRGTAAACEGQDRQRQKLTVRTSRGLRVHFGGRCGRFDFSHSLPLQRACERAGADVPARRVMFTSANNAAVATFCCPARLCPLFSSCRTPRARVHRQRYRALIIVPLRTTSAHYRARNGAI